MLLPERAPPTVLVIGGPLDRTHVAGLSQRARAALQATDTHPVLCDVGGLIAPDLVAVEALATLQLFARRLGHQFRLSRASAELRELIELAGLCEALPLEVEGQAEQREEAGGLEEERDSADPAT